MSSKIPVHSEFGLLELADTARIRQLERASNAQFIRRHSDGKLMRIMLYSYGEDHAMPRRRGNPQSAVHDSETEQNVQNVWTFKRWGRP